MSQICDRNAKVMTENPQELKSHLFFPFVSSLFLPAGTHRGDKDRRKWNRRQKDFLKKRMSGKSVEKPTCKRFCFKLNLQNWPSRYWIIKGQKKTGPSRFSLLTNWWTVDSRAGTETSLAVFSFPSLPVLTKAAFLTFMIPPIKAHSFNELFCCPT